MKLEPKLSLCVCSFIYNIEKILFFAIDVEILNA